MKYLFFTIFITLLFFQRYPEAKGQRFRVAQPTPFTIGYINSDIGLPTDESQKVMQDSNGYIWIGTAQGLARYDGYNIKLYTTGNSRNIGMISNHIIDIVEGENDNLWLATDKGLACFYMLYEQFVFYDESDRSPVKLRSEQINCLELDKEGRLWVGWAGYGIDVMNTKQGLVTHFDNGQEEHGLLSNWITTIFADRDNGVWVGAWEGGLTYMNLENNEFRNYTHVKNRTQSLKIESPYAFTQDHDGKIWMGTWGQGLMQLEDKNDMLEVVKYYSRDGDANESLSGNIIYDIKVDENDILWVANEDGIDYLSVEPDGTSAVYHFKSTTNTPHINKEIKSLTLSKEGILWACTMGRGVVIIHRRPPLFSSYNLPEYNDVSNQDIQAFTMTNNHKLLVGSLSRGFGEYDVLSKRYKHYREMEALSFLDIELNTVKCFEWDKEGMLWLGTRYNGLLKVDIARKKYLVMNNKTNTKNLDAREVNDIYTDSQGYMWVGTENGLFKIVQYSDRFEGFNIIQYKCSNEDSTTLSSDLISGIGEDQHHTIWVTTFNRGVNRLVSPKTVHFPLVFQRYQYELPHPFHISTNNINSIYKDSQNHLWFTSSGRGLLLWNDSTHEFQSVIDEDLITYDLIEDNNGKLWMTSNRGLSCLLYKDSIRQLDNFSSINGLQGNNFIKGASFKDDQGELYFGGNNGFNAFDPEDINIGRFEPPIRITSVQIDNIPIQPYLYKDTVLVLDYKQNRFKVEFSSLSYANPNKNKYAYFLKNFDSQWTYVHANMRTATYANLKPGDYQLIIRGTNSLGQWNKQPTLLNIKVNTAPYATWQAILSYVLLTLGVLGLITYMFIKSQSLKKAFYMEHVERAKSDKLNYFKQQLFTNISHELLTPITIVSYILEKEIAQNPQSERLLLMKRNIVRLTKLAKQFLNYRKSESGKLTLQVGEYNLIEFTESICINYKEHAASRNINFSYLIPEYKKTVWFDYEKVESILYNLLSNAFKFTPDGGDIVLALYIHERDDTLYAEFSISDTGEGIAEEHLPHIFDQFFSVKADNTKFSGFGIGLALTKANIQIHKGSVDVASKQGEGSKFTFTIPIHKEMYKDDELLKENKSESVVEFKNVRKISTPKSVQILEQLEQVKEDSYHILIVEDNDDFRSLLKEQLQFYFKVSDASNGFDALRILKTKAIDMVISDIIMPRMDGYQLCQLVKKNDSTSHIPVILATAKFSEDDRKHGYLVGADSFLTKPFAIDTMITRIQTIMNQRQQLVEKYSNKNSIHPEKIDIVDSDAVFLKKFKQILEKNMSEADFSIKQLCIALGMSNSMLYRKTRHLLNTSPHGALKEFRLNRAKQLLNSNELSISEVANKCGYTDVSYFGACFKKQFGKTPSEYINKDY